MEKVSKVLCRPMGDRLLCEDLPDVRKVGQIFVVKGDKNNTLDVVCSKLVGIGPDVKEKLSVGDYILHIRSTGVRYDGAIGPLAEGRGKFVFIKESEALAVVEARVVEKLSGMAFFAEDGARATSSL